MIPSLLFFQCSFSEDVTPLQPDGPTDGSAACRAVEENQGQDDEKPMGC